MVTVNTLGSELRQRGTLAQHRVLVSLVLEPKTAAFVLALRELCRDVAVFAAASETEPAIAAELVRRGVTVFAPREALPRAQHDAFDRRNAIAALDWRPSLLIDDGAHLIRLAHSGRHAVLESGCLVGASEETTSGVRPLAEMAAEGALRIPVVAANDARTKTGFDNLVGTGQSCVFAISELLDMPEFAAAGGVPGLAARRCTVIGYGPVGQGVARFAAALGADVRVVERDAVRALSAMHDGYIAVPLDATLADSELVISATGVWHTLDRFMLAELARRSPGVVLAVAGGIDDELALDELRAAGWSAQQIAANIHRWVPPDGAVPGDAQPAGATQSAPPADTASPHLYVLAGGGGVNYTALEGNPIEVMDLSFATQMLALERLASDSLTPGLHPFAEEDEDRIARAALAARGAGAEHATGAPRIGGAAQHWRVHRYRDSEALDSMS